ncbi:MAG TPA: hypothetical protein VGF18_01385, partial [Candidatus Tumulicola sp.]
MVFKASDKLCGSEHSQRIFFERSLAQNVDFPAGNICGAPVWVDQATGWNFAGHHIHAKVASGQIVLEWDVGAALHLEVPVADTDGSLAAGKRDVDGAAVDRELDHSESRPHDVDSSDSRKAFEYVRGG